jgi:hypothetical protein
VQLEVAAHRQLHAFDAGSARAQVNDPNLHRPGQLRAARNPGQVDAEAPRWPDRAFGDRHQKAAAHVLYVRLASRRR